MLEPSIGSTLREVLDNDLQGGLQTRPGLNAAAEVAAAHDATTRVVIEGILADEEQHLPWLQTEIDLYHRMGEPLNISNRITVEPGPTGDE